MMNDVTTIFWMHTGPKLSWDGTTFHIEDLNPEVSIKWRITPAELEQIGKKCLKLAQDAVVMKGR